MKSVFWTILRIQYVIIYKEQTKKMRCISERNKWFYAECDWSILPVYFSSYQQRRVFLSSGWFVTKVSFYVTGHVSQGSETKRPPSSRWVCAYFVSQQTELIQSETPPTSITDLICKGTWSINEDVLFEQCCFPHFFYHYYFVYLFIFWHKKLLSFVDTCLYIGADSRNAKPDKKLPRRQTESYCHTGRHQEQITKISGLPNEA